MGEKKYNHYVPRFYLANFSGSKKFIDKCMISSGKIIRGASTDSTGGENYLYGKDGLIEDAFTNLEGQWATIIKNVIKTEQIPTDPESYQHLLHFIVLSDVRTLAKANNTLDFWGEQYRVMATILKENGRMDIPDEVIESITAEAPIPNLMGLQEDIFLVDCCGDLHLALIKNISSLPFITSDHPSNKYNQLLISERCCRAFGYGQMGIQIFLPISPKLCLVLFDPVPYRLHFYDKEKFIINDPKIVRSINTLVAGYADRELYFSRNTSDRTIDKIIKHRKPNGLSPSAGSQRFGDGFLVYMSDPSYTHDLDIPLFSVIPAFRNLGLTISSSPPLRPHAEQVKDKEDHLLEYK